MKNGHCFYMPLMTSIHAAIKKRDLQKYKYLSSCINLVDLNINAYVRVFAADKHATLHKRCDLMASFRSKDLNILTAHCAITCEEWDAGLTRVSSIFWALPKCW